MEMCRFGPVLLLVLSAALPAEAQPPDVMPRYRKFLNQHVDPNMDKRMCNSVIYRRNITDGDTNNCKDVNTFIKADSNLVNTVCDGGTGQFTSGQPFTVVTCKLSSGKRPPQCEYRGRQSTRCIIIECDRGWPVHYAGDTGLCGNA